MKGNEEADLLAKKALNRSQIAAEVALSKIEIKVIIAKEIQKMWQNELKEGTKGRHLYCMQEKVGSDRRRFGNRKNYILKTRMRIGHCFYYISACMCDRMLSSPGCLLIQIKLEFPAANFPLNDGTRHFRSAINSLFSAC